MVGATNPPNVVDERRLLCYGLPMDTLSDSGTHSVAAGRMARIMLATGYNLREGSTILQDRFATLPHCAHCGDITAPDGRCLNVGTCTSADRAASRSSLRRGAAASARPRAWTLGGRVD